MICQLTGLRFLTVYDPWDHPDMMLQKFTHAMIADEKNQMYTYGKHQRDITYISNIIKGIIHILGLPATPSSDYNRDSFVSCKAPWRIYNMGNDNPVKLFDSIEAIEEGLNIKTEKELLPLQSGDISDTYIDDLVNEFNYKSSIVVKNGVINFLSWSKKYHKYSNCPST